MMESLFGSATPLWAGLATSGFGWPAAASPFANRPMAPSGTLSAPVGATLGMPVGPVGYDLPVLPTAGSIIATVAARRGQPMAPSSDAELEDFLYDCVEFLPGTGEGLPFFIERQQPRAAAFLNLGELIKQARIERPLDRLAPEIPIPDRAFQIAGCQRLPVWMIND